MSDAEATHTSVETGHGAATKRGPDAPPTSFDFIVESMTIDVTRSLRKDTDYATLAVAVIAPDGTQIDTYGPVSKYLGNYGDGEYSLGMSIEDVEVPAGGSVALAFVVLNNGHWLGDGTAINAMDVVASGVVGAIVQGGIAGAAGTVTVTLGPALAIVAVVVAALEGLTLLLADCDGVVVAGAMNIGLQELDANTTRPWDFTQQYAGTDSPDGCGDNSQYSVAYRVQTSGTTTVPHVVGSAAVAAISTVENADLLTVAEATKIAVKTEAAMKPPVCTSQSIAAGTVVDKWTEVVLGIQDTELEPFGPVKPGFGSADGSGASQGART